MKRRVLQPRFQAKLEGVEEAEILWLKKGKEEGELQQMLQSLRECPTWDCIWHKMSATIIHNYKLTIELHSKNCLKQMLKTLMEKDLCQETRKDPALKTKRLNLLPLIRGETLKYRWCFMCQWTARWKCIAISRRNGRPSGVAHSRAKNWHN